MRGTRSILMRLPLKKILTWILIDRITKYFHQKISAIKGMEEWSLKASSLSACKQQKTLTHLEQDLPAFKA
jgi:hypothetical protein